MPTTAQIEAYFAEHELERKIQEAVTEIVKDMPEWPLQALADKLAEMAEPAGPCYRITQIPIKPGSMPEIVIIANSDAFVEHTKSFVGFLGVDVFSAGDETMITCSRWADKAACDGGAAALGGVLKNFMSQHVAGPPMPPAVGVPLARMEFMPVAKTFYRLTRINFKPGTLSSALAAIKGMQPKLAAIAGVVDLTILPGAEGDTSVALSGWESEAAHDAAAPKVGEVLGAMMEFFAGKPETVNGPLQFALPPACYRITYIPIKPGSMPEIVKIANTDAMIQHTKTFVGFLGVEVLAVGDETMVTCSRWADKAACDGGAAALGGVLKTFMSQHVAGPPKPPSVGVPLARMVFKPTLRKTVYRTVTFAFKDAAAQEAALAIVRTKGPVFTAIDGLADLTLVAGPEGAEPPTVTALAGYDTMASLEAAGPTIKEVMMSLGSHYAAPPEPAAGTVEWQLPLKASD